LQEASVFSGENERPGCSYLKRFTACLLYAGVRIRKVFADRLEAEYRRNGEDHYLFSVDGSDDLIDATRQGSLCRFVNHSCG
jgi:SET domain-containing protein